MSPQEKQELIDRWRTATQPVVEEIRRMVGSSGLSHRVVETRAGFSRGYLSQLLSGRRDLKIRHVLAILGAIDRLPGELFGRVYPERRFPALSHFQETSSPLSEETGELLERLYGSGVESLNELRRRLARCERAVTELEDLGLVAKGRHGRGEES